MRTSSSGVRLNVNCKLRWLRELKILKKLCSPGRNVCYLIYCCLVLKRVINTGKVTCPTLSIKNLEKAIMYRKSVLYCLDIKSTMNEALQKTQVTFYRKIKRQTNHLIHNATIQAIQWQTPRLSGRSRMGALYNTKTKINLESEKYQNI